MAACWYGILPLTNVRHFGSPPACPPCCTRSRHIQLHHPRDELCRFINIVNIGGCPSDRVDITASCINAGVDFHPMIPLVSLFGLVHFWVTPAFPVLGRAWGSDDGGIHNRSAVHHQASLFKFGLHVRKNHFADSILFQ